jgi:hypothetical protein
MLLSTARPDGAPENAADRCPESLTMDKLLETFSRPSDDGVWSDEERSVLIGGCHRTPFDM